MRKTEERMMEPEEKEEGLGRRAETSRGGRRLRRTDSGAALSALAREARRRRVSYGTLCQMLTGEEREEILRAWEAEHPAVTRDEGRCAGCVYWRDSSATSPEMGRLCHFALDHGRSRRRDDETCLEYRREKDARSSGAAMWRASTGGRGGALV